MAESTPTPLGIFAPEAPLGVQRRDLDKLLAQAQELNQLLLKIQSEAMAALNTSATANMEAPTGLQKIATEAMQTRSRQISDAVDEIRKSRADMHTQQEIADQPIAAEEDPLARLHQEVPKS